MIFGESAPHYWAKNMPVIPLHKFNDVSFQGKILGKTPIPPAWQMFHDRMPTEEQQKEWLSSFSDNNMGLVLGKQSRCIALDIDTVNENEIEFIRSVVPLSPFIRIGKKGMVMMYRFNGEKTFRIKDITGRTICELLSSKTQVVLPPSIHPDTKMPYHADSNLYDVVEQLPILPEGIETILRNGLKDVLKVDLDISGWSRTTDYVSVGSRDVKMTSMAGIYALAVIRGERTLLEAMDMMRAWCANFVEKVAGDDIDAEKGVKNLINFLIRDVEGPKKKVLPQGWDRGLSADDKKKLGVNFGEDSVSWNFTRLNDYLCDQLPATALDPEARNAVIQNAVLKIAKSSNLNSLEEERCLKHIANTVPDITVVMLRKRVNEIRSEGITGDNHTEIAQAALRDLNDNIPVYEAVDDSDSYPNLRFVNDKFYRWAGSNWEMIDEIDIERFIATEYGNLRMSKKANDHRGIIQIMKSLLRHELGISGISGVNFANGFVDVFGNLMPHSRKYGCTYTLPYCYRKELADRDLKDTAPKFAKYLESVWGFEEDYEQRVKCLREVCAATMFGFGPSFNKAILLYGVGGSGKSQLMTIIQKMLPQQIVSAVSPYDFSDRFKVTLLSTSVLNMCGELKPKQPIPSDTFKQITDGAMLQGQYKSCQIFYFTPKATHWFASNFLPKSADGSEGFNRRWCILSFNRIVPTEEKIRDLGDIIVAEEREAIVAWAVGISKELYNKSDYDLPQSHYDLIDRMHAENDSVFFYLTADREDCPKRLSGSCVQIQTLYDKYRSFCYSTAAAQPISARRFLDKLKELGIICGFSVTSSTVSDISFDGGERIKRIIR